MDVAKRFSRKVHPTSRSCEVRGRVHRANNAMTLLFLLCIHCPVIDTNLTAAAPLHLEVVAPRIKRFLTEYFSPAEDPCWPNRAARPDTADCHCPSLRFNLQQKPPCLRGHCHNFRRWMPMARGGIVAWRQCRWKEGRRAGGEDCRRLVGVRMHPTYYRLWKPLGQPPNDKPKWLHLERAEAERGREMAVPDYCRK